MVEIVASVDDRATVRVDGMFLKIDSNRARADVETTAMTLAPVPTAEILWHTEPVVALAALPGTALDRLDTSATGSADSWAAAGA